VKRDPYDTDADAESLNTSVPRENTIQVDETQFDRELAQGYGETGESDYEDENDGLDDEEGADDEQHVDEQHHHQRSNQQRPMDANRFQTTVDVPSEIRRQVFGLLGEEGNSYPTTTSGGFEELDASVNGDLEQGFDDQDRYSHVSPTPPRASNNKHQPRHQAAEQATGLLRRPSTPAQAQPEPMDIFRRGNAIRSTTRSGVNATALPPQFQPGPTTDVPNTQPPTYSQSTRQPVAAAVADINNGHPSLNNPGNQALPRRAPGVRHVPDQTLQPPAKAVGFTVPIHNDRPAPNRRAAAARPPSPPPTEEESTHDESLTQSVEDYDHDVLFKMKYEDLKDEDFDTIPRKPTPVLSDDMLRRPLTERLEHVQRSLDANDQGKFFKALPTREWEEAGDWFLDQFGSIITRTREARQKKRKLAKEFEAEVEKRHRHVAKKRSQVEEALQKMSAQGQGLIPPKSPSRSSRSPRPTRY
jgi:hypothetical protein